MTPRILVIGDLMVDHYVQGRCERISPEAPVQVVEVEREYDLLGGAGNVVNNLLALGAQVAVAGVIGRDGAGEWIEGQLREKGVECHLFREDRPTTKKSRIIAAHQQIVRVDRESRIDITEGTGRKILDVVRQGHYDLILLSDYAKGLLTPSLTPQIISQRKAPVFVDPKSSWQKYRGADLLTPNRKEAQEIGGIPIGDDQSLQMAGRVIMEKLAIPNLLITLSEEGMALFEGEEMVKIPACAKEVYDVTGAGDTVLAAMGYSVATGKSLKEAARFANLAAGVVVGKVGAATATLAEIEEYERSLHKTRAQDLIKGFDEIERVVQDARRRGKKIVFTNGCFDLLHIGHIRYLERAKELGDLLIVGVNSDRSVRALKGPDRPIIPERERAELLAALEAVDYVVIFDEETPYRLIERVRPDLLVKGGDYRGKEVVGSDIAKETHLIDFVPGRSTTEIIERIRDDRDYR
ncbi:MAG: D-glycero-beta-D-manno-heptose-7-phosphate kinase [Epsilonproteobacteria bacterium]|nr:bifunctional heptose 7-phosphate kinase/heptose 1-phosphate adenyltransferase [Campylobacterota bacterium]NPA56439.1 D-glycero-beta-D-manno-heptose-7-phosphate kinase [Campylobacterota bacterium]